MLFFQSEDAIQFFQVVKSSPDITELYRGVEELPAVIFGLPTMLIGIFGKTYPKVVTMQDLEWHKLTNLSNERHMVSLSDSQEVGLTYGSGNLLTIDPTLFRRFIVDLHATYHQHMHTMPGRMEREAEHIALAVPYCSIKTIKIKEKEIANPFYLAIDSDNQKAIVLFNQLYCELVALLRQKYTRKLDDEKEQLALQAYVKVYLDFYDKYSGTNNPFNKTLGELNTLYPEFMKYFAQFNSQDDPTTLMRDKAMSASAAVFREHCYTRSLGMSPPKESEEIVTCYEDPWAKPNYD